MNQLRNRKITPIRPFLREFFLPVRRDNLVMANLPTLPPFPSLDLLCSALLCSALDHCVLNVGTQQPESLVVALGDSHTDEAAPLTISERDVSITPSHLDDVTAGVHVL
jgi:hypothetical protein